MAQTPPDSEPEIEPVSATPGDANEAITATDEAGDSTPRKRAARREHSFQDDVPHSAVARSTPDRLARALENITACARIADDNRAKDILLLDLRGATPLLDFFLIVTASTRRLANSIAIEIDVDMKKAKEFKLGMEGTEEGSWILIDYGDFVVHLFTPESRSYYSLEEVWGDAPRLDWRDPSRPMPPPVEPELDDEPEVEAADPTDED